MACSTTLDINPSKDIPIDKALNSSVSIENALQSAYAAMADTNLMGGNMFVIPIVLSDQVERTSSPLGADEAQIYNRNLSPDNSQINDTWRWAYRVINRVNLVIEKCESGENIDSDFTNNKDRFLGESYFLRGLMHFELAKLFAAPYNATTAAQPSILLRTAPVSDRSGTPPATLAAVYSQIIADLEKAKSLLPASYIPDQTAPIGTGLVVNGRATADAAQGYIAQVYMQMGAATGPDADRTIAAIDKTIGVALDSVNSIDLQSIPEYPIKYPLVSSNSFSNLFTSTGPRWQQFKPGPSPKSEVIFGALNATLNGRSRSTYLARKLCYDPLRGFSSPNYGVSGLVLDGGVAGQKFGTLYTAREIRRLFLSNFNGKSAVNKYSNFQTVNIILLRSPELMLNRAELMLSRNAPGDVGKALSDLLSVKARGNALSYIDISITSPSFFRNFNRLKQVAKNATSNAESRDTLLREVRNERLREFLFEPNRFFDLKRMGAAIPATADRPSADTKSLFLPIPTSETDNNLAF